MPPADGDLVVAGSWIIPENELQWSFGPSGGPGGQHANRSSTRAELRFDLSATTAFPEAVRARMAESLASRLVGTETVAVAVDETRSQWRNRQIARQRLAELLEEAARRPPRRRTTRPTAASRARRRAAKRARAEVKRLRRRPPAE